MSKNDITERGTLISTTNYENLIKAQSITPVFKDGIKKYKIISSRKIGGLRKGTGKALKLTNKSCNFRNLKEK